VCLRENVTLYIDVISLSDGILFLARDSILYAIARCMPSPVRMSVSHTGGSVKDG